MRRMAILAAGLLLSGCGSGLGEFEKQRPAIEAKTKSIEAIAGLIQSSPNFVIGRFDLPGPPPDFPPGGSAGPNATAIDIDDLADLTRSKGRLWPNHVADVASWGRKGSLSNGSKPKSDLLEFFRQDVTKFLGMKYLLVLRSTSEANPEAATMVARFKGGAWTADALLFDVEACRYVGGVSFEGRNDQRVEVRSNAAEAGLIENLRKNAIRDLQLKFKAQFPGLQPPCQ